MRCEREIMDFFSDCGPWWLESMRREREIMEVLFKGSGIAMTKNKPLNNLGVFVGSGTEALKTAVCADGDDFICKQEISILFLVLQNFQVSRQVQQGGEIYHSDKRLSYRENTPANPVESGHACIDRRALSEAYCRAIPAANTINCLG